MSRIRFVKILLVIIITAVAGVFSALGPEPAVVTIYATYLVGMSAFLGADIAKMIKETSLLPPGEFEDLKVWKYVVSGIMFTILVAITIIQKYWIAGATAASGLVIVISIILTGLNMNKAATGYHEMSTNPELAEFTQLPVQSRED